MRIAFVQHGDHKEARERFYTAATARQSTRHDTVKFVEELTDRFDFVGVCAMSGNAPYEEALTERLTSACVPQKPDGSLDEADIISLLEKWRLNYLVLQLPSRRILSWAIKQNIRTLPLFADGIKINSLGKRINAYRMKRLLNNNRTPILGVRNIPDSAVYRKVGVKREKIFPWQWTRNDTDKKYIANCDLTWTELIERWIDSPRRPAQTIMNKSLEARMRR